MTAPDTPDPRPEPQLGLQRDPRGATERSPNAGPALGSPKGQEPGSIPGTGTPRAPRPRAATPATPPARPHGQTGTQGQAQPPQQPATDPLLLEAAHLIDPAAPAAAPTKTGSIAPEILAFILSIAWLGALVAAFRILGDRGANLSDTLGLVVLALAVFLPLALIWLAVVILRAARDMREDALRLQAVVEGMRRAWVQQAQAAGLALKPTVEAKLDEIAAAQRKAEVQLARFSTRRDAPATPSPRATATPADGPDQPALALETTQPDADPLPLDVLIRALHFPQTPEDTQGFAALRRALADHATAGLIRAAQDVLTVLSEEGIYMDDLRPDRARPEVWRAFAQGVRGAEVSGLGGVRDRSCLALTYARMRSDPAFRETAHRFLRAFDLAFADFERHADDDAIVRLSETRSARAFMLLGRVTGMLG